MPKEFITERDIEDMVKRGVLSLEINDNVVLTDLAYERANRLGMKLLRDKPDNPPSAPMRPYISQPAAQPSPAGVMRSQVPSLPVSGGGSPAAPQASSTELHERIRSAVVARLGSQVDAKLLDAIITRVLQSTGVK